MNHWKYPAPKAKPRMVAIGPMLVAVNAGLLIWIAIFVVCSHIADMIEAAHIGDYIDAQANPQHYECPTRSC
ncbi:MAG: hypothetical protein ABJ360_22400 [Roseobacter sp.]